MKKYFLKSERIGFGIWHENNFQKASSLWENPKVTKYITASGSMTSIDIKHRLKLEIENYNKDNIQYYPIYLISTEEFIGCCGFRNYDEKNNILEMGIHLKEEFWGKGLAVEAAEAMMEYGFKELNIKGIFTGHNPNNMASAKLLKKLGFTYTHDEFYEPTGLYHPSYLLKRKEYISSRLKKHLQNQGADLVGFGELSECSIIDNDMKYGVAVAMAISKEVIKGINKGPTEEYYNAYVNLNNSLDNIVLSGEEFLKSFGYKAYAQTVDRIKENEDFRSELPHKTVATRSGLGWIGKNALLVTKEFGSAIRLSSLITNCELEHGQPITVSNCGQCEECVKACPGEAIKGQLWSIERDRDELVNPLKCRKKARALAKNNINRETTVCGKCIEVCPFTRAYINKNH